MDGCYRKINVGNVILPRLNWSEVLLQVCWTSSLFHPRGYRAQPEPISKPALTHERESCICVKCSVWVIWSKHTNNNVQWGSLYWVDSFEQTRFTESIFAVFTLLLIHQSEQHPKTFCRSQWKMLGFQSECIDARKTSKITFICLCLIQMNQFERGIVYKISRLYDNTPSHTEERC